MIGRTYVNAGEEAKRVSVAPESMATAMRRVVGELAQDHVVPGRRAAWLSREQRAEVAELARVIDAERRLQEPDPAIYRPRSMHAQGAGWDFDPKAGA